MSEFVKVKTQDLIGVALNWSVARASGADQLSVTASGSICCIYELPCGSGCWTAHYEPSTDWACGGPLIAKYHMDFCCEHPETIGAALCDENGMYIDEHMIFGSTHLEAACRALVHHKFGDTVSVPNELLP